MNSNVIALDFDGVICDSAAECVVSAYGAFLEAKGEEFDPLASPVPDYFRDGFYRMRPLIRDGRDYLMILYLLDLGVPMSDQKDFDDALEARLPDLLGCLAWSRGPSWRLRFSGIGRAFGGGMRPVGWTAIPCIRA